MPDYESGPESGYITPDQQGSENEYPINHAAAHLGYHQGHHAYAQGQRDTL